LKPAAIILLVEDEALIAMDLQWKLVEAGYRVCRMAATGEDAVHWAERDRPDLVLMDNRLAGKIDGIEAALQIRSKSDVPVIFMTGYPQDDVFWERVKPVKPIACLTKPVIIEELLKIIPSALAD
jgi:DNA-binding response OmpR family regulator